MPGCRPRAGARLTSPPAHRQGTRREARVGRAGGGRPLHPAPDLVLLAKAKVCPPCDEGVSAVGQSLQAVCDKIELPPVMPIVTRVEPDGGRGAGCGPPAVALVPAGLEPSTPLGASVPSLATYLRDTHAISDERLSALVSQVCGLDSSEGGLANVFQLVKGRLDQRVADILPRLRRRRLIGRDETSARAPASRSGKGCCRMPRSVSMSSAPAGARA
jgi:transposase